MPIDLLDENAQAPNDRQSVLIYSKERGIHVAEYQRLTKDTRRGHHQFMEIIECYDVIYTTHWMPLPDPPKE